MFDVALTREILSQIHGAPQTILAAPSADRVASGLPSSDEGMEKLDATCM